MLSIYIFPRNTQHLCGGGLA